MLIHVPAAAPPTHIPWYQFIGEVDWLLNDIDYVRSAPALIGLRETVLATRRVNEAQRHAVDAIRAQYEAA